MNALLKEIQMVGKNKLTDMSIDPTVVKVKTKEPEVTSSDSKAPKVRTLKEKKEPHRRPSHHRGHGKQKATVCVSKGEEVQRVLRKDAEKLVDTGWTYCSRTKWRKSLKTA
jgi:hypothetical protein